MTGTQILHIGCYTAASGGRGTGIVAVRRDPGNGTLDVLDTVAVTESPSFLARHPRLPVLYAVNEVPDGTISAWNLDGDGSGPMRSAAGTPRLLGVRSTGGAAPCHLAVTPDGGHLVVANYGGGSLAVHPLDAAGVPGERTDLLVHHGHGRHPQQSGPHPHMVSPESGGGGLLAVDLGTDTVYAYDLDPAAGRLLPRQQRTRTAAGTGPRHLARHPDGRRCFLVGELAATVTAYELDGGVPHERGSVPASVRRGHVQPSEVAVSADGRFLYVANRGVNTLAVFALDDMLPRHVAEVSCGGDWPRHFALVGQHLYVANERSHTISIFTVDPDTGVPAVAAAPVEVGSPTCVLPTA